MRKVAALAVAVAAVSIAAVAYAAQVNTYTVSGGVSPSKPGTKAKPSPVKLSFNYTVGEQAGQRPSPVKRYTIGFYGGVTNGGLFPKCTAAQINAAQSDSGCPSGSKVGTGSVSNQAGATANAGDTSIKCDLTLGIYNSGQDRAALFLKGAPPQCAVAISQAIDAKYVSAFGGKGRALQFEVPAGLLHPIPGVDNAVVNVKSTINKLTKKSKGKTRGYFESTGCKSGKRAISVDFLTEAGQTSTASASQAC